MALLIKIHAFGFFMKNILKIRIGFLADFYVHDTSSSKILEQEHPYIIRYAYKKSVLFIVLIKQFEFIISLKVGVKDYGDMENMDLQERFGVKKDDFPVVKLFVQGQSEPIDFEGEFNEDNLKKFIRMHSEVYIGLENCLEKYDRIADKFISTKDEVERKKLLRDAEDEWDILKNPSDRKSAETYVKLMRRMREKGDEYVREEKARIDKLLKEKVSKEKKSELEGKINILRSFVKDEL
ncbi:unnamed protein product, partial [Meganyctiphanes norvegica]